MVLSSSQHFNCVQAFSLIKGVKGCFSEGLFPSMQFSGEVKASLHTHWGAALGQQQRLTQLVQSQKHEDAAQSCFFCLFKSETNLDPVQKQPPTSLCNTQSVPGVCSVPLGTETHQFCIRTGTQCIRANERWCVSAKCH